MEVRFGVHWWRFTPSEKDVDVVCDHIASVSGGDFGPVQPRGGFNQPGRVLHDSGAAVYFGSKREGQPIVVDVPGEACELVAVGDLAAWAEGLSGRVSRCDVAADVEPRERASARLLELRAAFRAGECATRIPVTSTRFYESDEPGDGRTLYVGSVQSECFLRAYDRRGPLRLEWEWKPDASLIREELPATLTRYGPAGIWRKLAHRCIWPMEWYKELLNGQAAELGAEPGKRDSLARFVAATMDQSGPSLWAALAAGLLFKDFLKRPEEPNAEQVRKWAAWCVEARELGYDPSKLEREVKRWRRRRS